MQSSFLQTKSWMAFQEAVGHKTWRFDDGAMTATIIQYRGWFGKNYLYIPHGPQLSLDVLRGGVKNEVKAFMSQLMALAREEKSMFVKIEPLTDAVTELIYRRGFRLSRRQIQPYRTVVVDITRDTERMLSDMHHKTRYNIGLAEKKGVTVQESRDIDTFLALLKKTAEADNFSTHPPEYYTKMMEVLGGQGELQVKLFLAHHEGQAVAGALVLVHGQRSYYLHGAMDRDQRALMAPYALHWGIVQYLKKQHVTHYDLWGIDAHRWPGVTRFKSGWGGTLVELPGSFDIPISGFWYRMYGLGRWLLRR